MFMVGVEMFRGRATSLTTTGGALMGAVLIALIVAFLSTGAAADHVREPGAAVASQHSMVQQLQAEQFEIAESTLSAKDVAVWIMNAAETAPAFMSGLVSVLISTLALTAFGVFVWAFFKEYNNNSIRIEPQQAAERLVAMGYTPQVLAARLEAVMLDRRKTSRSSAERAVSERIGAKAEFIIPGAGLSLKALAAYARDLRGKPFPSISGELTVEGEEGAEKVLMRLRLNGERISECIQVLCGDGIDRLMETCVVDVMKDTEPSVIASYLADTDPERGKEIIAEILATEPNAEIKASVLNTLGNILSNEGNFDSAIIHFRLATDINPKMRLSTTIGA